MLALSDIRPGGTQDKNAGNSGDLGKHTTYLVLLDVLTQARDWADSLTIVEAHSGKGIYVPAHRHWRRLRDTTSSASSVLVAAEAAAFAPEPAGIGHVQGLEEAGSAYAGSSLLHALALRNLRQGAMVCYDRSPDVRATLSRVLLEPAFADRRPAFRVLDPGAESEPLILRSMAGGEYGKGHVLHLDPFAFVVGRPHASTRESYRTLVIAIDSAVAEGRLRAATLFITWGQDSAAARADLFEGGGKSRRDRGYQELIDQVRPAQQVVMSWCWLYYFAMVVVVPSDLRTSMVSGLRAGMQAIEPFCSHLEIR